MNNQDVAIKPVILTVGTVSESVVGLVTTAGPNSFMSERLADRLGIIKTRQVPVLNCHGFHGYMPDRIVFLTCKFHPVGPDSNDCLVMPMAFLILPNTFNELVLGTDWFNRCMEEGNMSIQMSTVDRGDPSTKYMHVSFGTPSPGPTYRNGASSVAHLIDIGDEDRQHLDEMISAAAD